MTLPTDLQTAPQTSAGPDQPRGDHDELIMFLEPDQFVRDRSIAVPPARLNRRARAGLWLLRIFALIVSLMVMYTFIAQLH
ncbi:MAG: hypothetical protein ACLP50_07375 [Solirubrobacteraceae bacterium]